MKEEKNKSVKPVVKDNKKTKTVKKLKKIKVGYVLAFIIILLIAILVLKLVLPSSTSKYGDRLDGIEKITFGDKEKDAIVKKVKESDKVTDAKIDVKGKIIYVIYNVKKDCSKEDAKNIGNDSLGVISDEVKKFYDLNYIASKNDEEGQKVSEPAEDGSSVEKVVKEFPIMGYKNKKTGGIVW